MSKPLDTTSPMYRVIEKQLMEAMGRDGTLTCGGACGNAPDTLGVEASAVLAEILGSRMPGSAELTDGYILGLLDHKRDRWPHECTSLMEFMRSEVKRLTAIINQPESDDFIKGVSIEAEFQRRKHGVDDGLSRREWMQWLWVAGYLLNKAVAACMRDDMPKAKHHLVTTAGLLANWHNVLTGKPAASVHSNHGQPVADVLAGDTQG